MPAPPADFFRPDERWALVLDFDGTLADIGPDPDAVFLPDPTPEVLLRLSGRMDGALAVLSGRLLADLARRVPSGLWRIGAHGLQMAAPDAATPAPLPPPPSELLAPLRAVVAAREGVWLEIKGPVAALHYRAVPDAAADCVSAAGAAADAVDGHVVQPGKMVVEVKPAAASKGAALRRLMDLAPFAGRRALMIGDDATDEDAMRAALALGGSAVKVGAGDTVAPYRLPDPAAMRGWLARMAEPND